MPASAVAADICMLGPPRLLVIHGGYFVSAEPPLLSGAKRTVSGGSPFSAATSRSQARSNQIREEKEASKPFLLPTKERGDVLADLELIKFKRRKCRRLAEGKVLPLKDAALLPIEGSAEYLLFRNRIAEPDDPVRVNNVREICRLQPKRLCTAEGRKMPSAVIYIIVIS